MIEELNASFDSLESWTEHPDALVKYFSGIAIYRKDVEIDASTGGKPVYLDLGDEKEIARVVVNGTDLGTVWVKKTAVGYYIRAPKRQKPA